MDNRHGPTSSPCDEIHRLMRGESEEDLDDLEARRIENHLEICTSCRSALEKAGEKTWWEERLRDQPVDYPDQQGWRNIREKIQQTISEESGRIARIHARPFRQRMWKRVLPLAAAILFSLVFVYNVVYREEDFSGEAEGVYAEITDIPEGMESIIIVMEDEDAVIMISISNG